MKQQYLISLISILLGVVAAPTPLLASQKPPLKTFRVHFMNGVSSVESTELRRLGIDRSAPVVGLGASYLFGGIFELKSEAQVLESSKDDYESFNSAAETSEFRQRRINLGLALPLGRSQAVRFSPDVGISHHDFQVRLTQGQYKTKDQGTATGSFAGAGLMLTFGPTFFDLRYRASRATPQLAKLGVDRPMTQHSFTVGFGYAN
jgi:hypothetical protein